MRIKLLRALGKEVVQTMVRMKELIGEAHRITGLAP